MLKEQVFKTIKYFDVQDHCLTLVEISKYLLADGSVQESVVSLSDILNAIEKDLSVEIQTKHGFYFLSGRGSLAQKRLENNFFATPRLKRAQKYLRYVRHIPFISAVALTGSEAINNSKKGSDIDLLVLTKPNRIWLGRIFLSAFFHLFGVRRHGNYITNRFCLNHYIEQSKQIDIDQNTYTAVEYVSLVPYFGGEAVYEFQQKNLGWIHKYLQQPQIVKYQTQKGSIWQKFWESLFANPIGNILENLAGIIQRRRIQVRSNIVITPNELAFHPGSKGQQVLGKVNF